MTEEGTYLILHQPNWRGLAAAVVKERTTRNGLPFVRVLAEWTVRRPRGSTVVKYRLERWPT